MNETKNDVEKTADGDPLIDRGTADSARDSVSDPEEEDDELEDDDDKEDEEDVDL